MSAESLVLHLFTFALGAVVGSFANVCIHRLPRRESVVRPRSRCPACGAPIAAWDNVPVVSWLLLRGRCRRCRAPISIRYPLIEATLGAAFVLATVRHGFGPEAVAAAILATAAVILAATDLQARVLPDEVTYGVLALGLLLAAARDLPDARKVGAGALAGHLLPSVAGAAFGAALLLGVGLAYRLVRGAEGMGLGDVKMIAMGGAFVGPAGVLVALFVASVSGVLAAGAPALVRALRWRLAFRSARGSEERARDEGERHGALLTAGGTVVAAAGRRWREIPGNAPPGAKLSEAGPVARPVVAFVRLARRRSRRGEATSFGRLAVEDETGEFFRVLAARAEALPGGLLVLLGRVDVPFGVFLAGGILVAYEWGGAAVDLLTHGLPVPGRGLLP